MGDLFIRFGKPKHFITDHGNEFQNLALGVDHRFGRVGCPASTARVERFFKSLKWECLRYLFCPTVKTCQHHLDQYQEFFNRWRPHQALAGKTPDEVYRGADTSIKPTHEGFTHLREADAERLTFCDGVITVFRRKAA